MLRLLHIDSSARPGRSGEQPHGSHTRRLSARFVRHWQRLRPQDVVVYRDVAACPPTPVTGEWVHAAFTPPAQRVPWMHAVLAESDALVDELISADLIVIGVPMYNFGVPSTLRSYFDHVARAGVTFRYTAAGPEGLLRDKRAVIFVTRGGKYSADQESQTAYLRQFLGFLGVKDVEFIYAEGLSLGEVSIKQSLSAAHASLRALASQHHALAA